MKVRELIEMLNQCLEADILVDGKQLTASYSEDKNFDKGGKKLLTHYIKLYTVTSSSSSWD